MDMAKSGKDYDYVFKIVLIGDTCVGKSCLLVRFSDDQFTENYVTTIGVDFRFKTMIVLDKTTKVQIWDTAGQERYRSITNAYYRGAEAIIIVFDLTNKDSFNHINDWIEEITKYTGPNIFKLVVGNKCDLVSERRVTDEEIQDFEKKYNIKIMQVSAKSGKEVESAFKYIVENLIMKKYSLSNSREKVNTPNGIANNKKLKNNGINNQIEAKDGCCKSN